MDKREVLAHKAELAETAALSEHVDALHCCTEQQMSLLSPQCRGLDCGASYGSV